MRLSSWELYCLVGRKERKWLIEKSTSGGLDDFVKIWFISSWSWKERGGRQWDCSCWGPSGMWRRRSCRRWGLTLQKFNVRTLICRRRCRFSWRERSLSEDLKMKMDARTLEFYMETTNFRRRQISEDKR